MTAAAEFESPLEERHIDFLLEEEFASSHKFLEWFITTAVTSREGIKENFCNKAATNTNCHVTRSVKTGKGESDVLVIYEEAGSDKRVAILIEDKIGANFQDDQAGRYRKRGEDGIGQHWDIYWTCLVCPDRYSKDLAGFDAKITFEKLAEYFEQTLDARSRYKARVFRSSIRHALAKGVKHVDPTMTNFRKYYADFMTEHLHGTHIVPDSPRDAWWDDTWFTFRHPSFPHSTFIVHKSRMGAVQLTFPEKTTEELRTQTQKWVLPEGCRIVATGKGSSLQIDVPKLKHFSTPETCSQDLEFVDYAVQQLASIFDCKQGELSRYQIELRCIQKLLGALMTARLTEFTGKLSQTPQPNLLAMDERHERSCFITVPGMSGGFDIRLETVEGSSPVVFAASGSRIQSMWMHHCVTPTTIESISIDEITDDFDEFISTKLREFRKG